MRIIAPNINAATRQASLLIDKLHLLNIDGVSSDPELLMRYRAISDRFNNEELRLFGFARMMIEEDCFLVGMPTQYGMMFLNYSHEDLLKIFKRFPDHYWWENQQERFILMDLLSTKVFTR